MSPARPSSPSRNTVGLMYYSKMIFKYITIFFIWLTPTVLQADPWQIDQDENFITLKKNGEIQHGNSIHFNFDKENICKFNVFFFICTSVLNYFLKVFHRFVPFLLRDLIADVTPTHIYIHIRTHMCNHILLSLIHI